MWCPRFESGVSPSAIPHFSVIFFLLESGAETLIGCSIGFWDPM